MAQKIQVTPIASESFGVRSLCTYIETPNVNILLDAGVSIVPSRFRLPPHPREFKALIEARNRIAEFGKRADVITISHYHFDHHTPSYEDWFCNWTNAQTAKQIYEGKIVLAKNPRGFINASQRRRGWIFQKTGGKHVKKLRFVDGKSVSFGETKLKFSQPVFHGLPDTPLGWVLMTTIEYNDERVLFASDVQGPMDDATVKIIQSEKPHLLIIGGPPTYLRDYRVTGEEIRRGLDNLTKLVNLIPVTILDHHLLRDAQWRKSSREIFESAHSRSNQVVTAAEFMHKKNKLLEANRERLFRDEPPNHEFQVWYKLPEDKRRRKMPPIEC